jgi:hypothetical protein
MEETRVKDEESVSRLLSSLPATEAPENFEAMVRTRVAERRGSRPGGRPIFWLVLKFSAPMLLLVLLGGFLVISDSGSLNLGMVPPVEAPGVGSADLSFDEATNVVAVNTGNSSRQSLPNRNAVKSETGPSSEEKALTPDDTTMFPPGVDPRRVAPTNQKPPTGGQISPTSILGMLGIATDCSNSGCRVVSIQSNSLASKIGLEVDDLIEAIDDRRIGAGRSFEGEVSVSSLRILRGGKRSTIRVASR